MCVIKFRVTEVERQLASVYHICQKGHGVRFKWDGGNVNNLVTEQTIMLKAVGCTYHMEADMSDKESASMCCCRRAKL